MCAHATSKVAVRECCWCRAWGPAGFRSTKSVHVFVTLTSSNWLQLLGPGGQLSCVIPFCLCGVCRTISWCIWARVKGGGVWEPWEQREAGSQWLNPGLFWRAICLLDILFHWLQVRSCDDYLPYRNRLSSEERCWQTCLIYRQTLLQCLLHLCCFDSSPFVSNYLVLRLPSVWISIMFYQQFQSVYLSACLCPPVHRSVCI